MTLTQRERYIAIATAAVLAVVMVGWSLIHYISARHDLGEQIDDMQRKLKIINDTRADQFRYSKLFNQMVKDGLKSNPADAKGQVRDALEQWAPASGVSEKSLNDDRYIHDPDFDQISFKLDGSGPMATVVRLLNRCETTTLPLKVAKITISPVSEGRDYVKFELTVSTLCRNENPKASRPGGSPFSS